MVAKNAGCPYSSITGCRTCYTDILSLELHKDNINKTSSLFFHSEDVPESTEQAIALLL